MSDSVIAKAVDSAAPPQSAGIPPYPLNEPETTIVITVAGRDMKLEHKLRRPTLAELIERDEQSSFTTENVGNDERIEVDDERANSNLWDKLALQVRGYKLNGSIDWAEVGDTIKQQMPGGHKAAAIRGLYSSSFELEDAGEDEGFVLGDTAYTVKQEFGDYVIRHIFRSPTEKERREFRQRASETRFTRGSRKVKTKLTTKLKAYVELYDLLSEDVQGVTGGNQAMIDPIWKRGAIEALMKAFEAQAQD